MTHFTVALFQNVTVSKRNILYSNNKYTKMIKIRVHIIIHKIIIKIIIIIIIIIFMH